MGTTRHPVKGFWDRIAEGMRHERVVESDNDHAIMARPKAVPNFSKVCGRESPIMREKMPDRFDEQAIVSPSQIPSEGRQSPKSAAGPDSFSRGGSRSQGRDVIPAPNGVPHLPEDKAKPSATWFQWHGAAPRAKGAAKSAMREKPA